LPVLHDRRRRTDRGLDILNVFVLASAFRTHFRRGDRIGELTELRTKDLPDSEMVSAVQTELVARGWLI
jgi:hypothetical protein